MSSSPETSVFHLRINQGLLDCTNCHRTLRPETYHWRAYTCRQCIRGQIYCRDCIHRHHCLATDTHSTCNLLNNIIAQMKFKCDCNKYIPYCEFLGHQRECPSAKYSTHPARWRKCILKTSFLQCSECKVPLRPPIFSLWLRNRLICSACYRADIGTYRHCTELEYLLQGITVKCVACKQYLPFSTLGSHQVGDCLKHKLQNIAPGSSARKKFCDEDETERPTARNSCIHGKNKRKACYEVGKMGKHIVHGDAVGNDDDSSDDNHEHLLQPRLAHRRLDTYPSQLPRSHLVAQAPVSSKQPTTGQGPATRTKCEDPNIHLGCAASSSAGSSATH